MDNEPPAPGTVLAEKYRVERVLGQGGMGLVLEATHLLLGSRVAIKVLLPEMLKHPQIVARFELEARTAASLRSDHVVRVLDIGKLNTGAPFMVMEYLEGEDLGAKLSRGLRIQPSQAVDYLLQACEAIAEAHSLGIIHRDLKSANLFCARRAGGGETIKVLDFGISKSSQSSDLGMTGTSTVMGSPNYMSPDQMTSSKRVDLRTDIWALGVILYELLSGQLPFIADTMPELVLLVAGNQEPDWQQLAMVDPGLVAAVGKCLQRDRDARFRSVAELAHALLPFAPFPQGAEMVARIDTISGQPMTATSRDAVGPFSAPASAAVPSTARPPGVGLHSPAPTLVVRTEVRKETTMGPLEVVTDSTRPPLKTHAGLWWALGLGLVGVGSGAAVFLSSGSPTPVSPSSLAPHSAVASGPSVAPPEPAPAPAEPAPTVASPPPSKPADEPLPPPSAPKATAPKVPSRPATAVATRRAASPAPAPIAPPEPSTVSPPKATRPVEVSPAPSPAPRPPAKRVPGGRL